MAYFEKRKTLLRFVFRMKSHSVSLVSSTFFEMWYPALLTMMSSRPSSSVVRADDPLNVRRVRHVSLQE